MNNESKTRYTNIQQWYAKIKTRNTFLLSYAIAVFHVSVVGNGDQVQKKERKKYFSFIFGLLLLYI